MALPILKSDEFLAKLIENEQTYHSNYYAMYSSWLGGVVTNPNLMILPVDDHMVHRGDGIFEAFKAKDSKIYLLDSHLQRLQNSAEAIHLKLPESLEGIAAKCLETLKISGKSSAMVRLFVSRGPGGFTTNPYETVGSQLYVIVTKLNELPESLYQSGVTAGLSLIPSKAPSWAAIKCCNYLPNVLMKKEAVDRGLHFTISLDEEGNLGEGSTENIAAIDQESNLIYPPFDRTLKGTTLRRLAELSQPMVKQGIIKSIQQRHLHRDELASLKELMFVGTTLDVLPVAQVEDHRFVANYESSVAKRLRSLLTEDMLSGPYATSYAD